MTEKKPMTTHALVNVNDIISTLKEHGAATVIDYLESLLIKESRGEVLSEQEILLCLSNCLEVAAHRKDALNDQLLRMFWEHGESILRKHSVIR